MLKIKLERQSEELNTALQMRESELQNKNKHIKHLQKEMAQIKVENVSLLCIHSCVAAYIFMYCMHGQKIK